MVSSIALDPRTEIGGRGLSLSVLKEQFLHVTDLFFSCLYPGRSVDEARLASYNALKTECVHSLALWSYGI